MTCTIPKNLNSSCLMIVPHDRADMYGEGLRFFPELPWDQCVSNSKEISKFIVCHDHNDSAGTHREGSVYSLNCRGVVSIQCMFVAYIKYNIIHLVSNLLSLACAGVCNTAV